MKKFYLDRHSSFCKDKYCLKYPDKFLFFFNNDFYFILYHKCMEFNNHLNFKEEIIQLVCKGKLNKLYEVDRTFQLNKDFENFIKRGVEFKKYIVYVNYIYADAANKEYAITTELPFVEALKIDENILTKNYVETKNYLLENGYDYMVNNLDLLYHYNQKFTYTDNYTIVKMIDKLIDNIKKELL